MRGFDPVFAERLDERQRQVREYRRAREFRKTARHDSGERSRLEQAVGYIRWLVRGHALQWRTGSRRQPHSDETRSARQVRGRGY